MSLCFSRLLFPSFYHTGSVCVVFWYHMFGFHIDTLSLIILHMEHPYIRTVLWRASKEKDEDWHVARVKVMLDERMQVRSRV